MALTYARIAIVSNGPWALVPLPVAIAVIDRGVIVRVERYFGRAVHGIQPACPPMDMNRSLTD
jgi:hypothetical protein